MSFAIVETKAENASSAELTRQQHQTWGVRWNLKELLTSLNVTDVEQM